MHSRQNGNLDAPDGDRVADDDLHDVRVALPPNERTDASGHDDQRLSRKHGKRREVEVVAMGMRDQDHIDRGHGFQPGAGITTEVSDATSEQRVGEHLHAVDVEQHG